MWGHSKKEELGSAQPLVSLLATHGKFLKEGVKKLEQFQRAGLSFGDSGAQLSAFLNEFAEALAEERTDTTCLSAKEAIEQLGDLLERIEALFVETFRKISEHAIAPLQAVVDSQVVVVKESRKKLEKALSHKKKGSSLSGSISSSSSSSTITLNPNPTPSPSTLGSEEAECWERIERDTLETFQNAGQAYGIQCLKLYTTLHRTFEHLFKAGTQTVADFEAFHVELKHKISPNSLQMKMEVDASNDSRKALLSQLTEYEKRYMVSLTYLLSVKHRLEAVKDSGFVSDLATIFGNTEEIFSEHVSLLTEMEKGSVSEDVSGALATLFASHKDKIESLYTKYVGNYSMSLAKLRQVRKQHSDIDSVLKNCRMMQDVMTPVKLSELLALPCRHIHKLKFFLQAIYDSTQSSEKGWTALRETITSLGGSIEAVDRAKATSDRVAQLLRVAKSIIDPNAIESPSDSIVNASRVLLHDSDIALISSSSSDCQPGSDHHLFLFSDIMLLTKKLPLEGSDSQKQKYKPIFRCQVISLTIGDDIVTPSALAIGMSSSSRNVFRVGHSNGDFLFAVNSEAQRATWLARLRAANASRRRTQVFGVDLHEILNRKGEHGRDIPSFISELLELLSSPQAIETEGIFRLSGSALELTRVRAAVDSGEHQEVHDIHVASSLLKLWLRLLPVPILQETDSIRSDWLSVVESGKSTAAKLKEVLRKMSAPNRFLLTSIIKVLNLISKNSAKNMMTAPNLGIVFAPTLFKSTGFGSNSVESSLVGTNKLNQLIELLIENFDAVFADSLIEQSRVIESYRIKQQQGAMIKSNTGAFSRLPSDRNLLMGKGRPRSLSATMDKTEAQKSEAPPSPLQNTVRISAQQQIQQQLLQQIKEPISDNEDEVNTKEQQQQQAIEALTCSSPEKEEPIKVGKVHSSKSLTRIEVGSPLIQPVQKQQQQQKDIIIASTSATLETETSTSTEPVKLVASLNSHSGKKHQHRQTVAPTEFSALEMQEEGNSNAVTTRRKKHTKKKQPVSASPETTTIIPIHQLVSPRAEPELVDASPRPISGISTSSPLPPPSTSCLKCSKAITDEEKGSEIRVGNKIWHKGCFVCTKCDCVLTIESFVLEIGQPICLPCFKKRSN